MFMMLDVDGDDWVYRRHRSIRGRIAELGRLTDTGIPYLSPEIQLLFNSKDHGRQKDFDGFLRTLPALPPEKARWLLECLAIQSPGGHPWNEHIERFLAGSG